MVPVLGLGRTTPLGNPLGLHLGLLLGLKCGFWIRTERDRPQGAVDKHRGAGNNAMNLGAGCHDTGNIQLAGNDGGVRRRTTQFRDQAHEQIHVEGGGIGRGQVVGEEHHALGHVRQTWLRLTTQLRNDPVADIPKVSSAFCHHAAGGFEHCHEFSGGRDNSIFCWVTTGNTLPHCLAPTTVIDHASGCLQHLGSCALGMCRTLKKPLGHDVCRIIKPAELSFPLIFRHNLTSLGQFRAGADPYCRRITHPGDHSSTF